LNRSTETIKGSRELETIKRNEREQQRAGNDQTKPKRAAESLNQSNEQRRAAESLNRSNEPKESSRELVTINRNQRGQQRA
jgi:hypothetical protein